MNIWPGVALLLGILLFGSAFSLYALWSDRRHSNDKDPNQQQGSPPEQRHH